MHLQEIFRLHYLSTTPNKKKYKCRSYDVCAHEISSPKPILLERAEWVMT